MFKWIPLSPLSLSLSLSLSFILFILLSLCFLLSFQYILSRLHQLNQTRWSVTTDTFTDSTPFGSKSFTNIIATLDPDKPNRLVLAAHYDSKYFVRGEFLGAVDSALPVALIIDLVLTLDEKLQSRGVSFLSLSLSLFLSLSSMHLNHFLSSVYYSHLPHSLTFSPFSLYCSYRITVFRLYFLTVRKPSRHGVIPILSMVRVT